MEEEKGKIEQEIKHLIEKRDLVKDEIEDYKSSLIASADGAPTILEQLNLITDSIDKSLILLTEKVDKINELFDNVMIPIDGAEKPRLQEVLESCEVITKKKDEIDQSLEMIDGFKLQLLGDDENEVKGLKHRFDKYEEDIKSKQKDWTDSQKALSDKIEGLLPGATATGLAKAYQDQRKSYTRPYWLWAMVFVLTMIGMIYFAIDNLKSVQNLNEAFMVVVSRLPFFIPAFWLAIFASKQQSQNKRLQQEYAYKETLTKSYEADKREIESMPESDKKNILSEKLLSTMIDMTKENPSETLHSSSHNDGPPSVLDLFKIKLLKKLQGGE